MAVVDADVHVRTTEGWQHVPSLGPFLSRAFAAGQLMDAQRMSTEEVVACRWVGYGVGKGVTHPGRGMTAFAVPRRLRSALHGALIQRFDGVDRSPRCYDRSSKRGFGGFIRWVLFSGPAGDHILGVDWHLQEVPHIGVATHTAEVVALATTLLAHGIPAETELVLLNDRMCEEPEDAQRRQREQLVTVTQWSQAIHRLAPRGTLCPRCGQPTFTHPSFQFCHLCGSHHQPEGGSHVLETRKS